MSGKSLSTHRTARRVAINANPVPRALVTALDSGRWMELSSSAGQLLGADFGIRALYPELYDYMKIVRATAFITSEHGAPYWPGGLDPQLDIDPSRCVIIGDPVGADEDFLALDTRTDTPNVRLLTDLGWEHVASSIDVFLERLEMHAS